MDIFIIFSDGETNNKQVPTTTFHVETIHYQQTPITLWDLGGSEKLRFSWQYYYQGTDGIIFVVDSTNQERLDEAREVLNMVLEEKEDLKKRPVLIFANKRDDPSALSVADITSKLGLKDEQRSSSHAEEWKINKHRITVRGCIATEGKDLLEGIGWLHTRMVGKKHK